MISKYYMTLGIMSFVTYLNGQYSVSKGFLYTSRKMIKYHERFIVVSLNFYAVFYLLNRQNWLI